MKKIMILLFLFSMGSFLGLESCKDTTYFQATVVADGNPDVDGCGWLLYIDGINFYPVGLRGQDLEDGKVITIQYTVSAVPYKCVNNIEYPVASITKFR